jgi:hypothetical protein
MWGEFLPLQIARATLRGGTGVLQVMAKRARSVDRSCQVRDSRSQDQSTKILEAQKLLGVRLGSEEVLLRGGAKVVALKLSGR